MAVEGCESCQEPQHFGDGVRRTGAQRPSLRCLDTLYSLIIPAWIQITPHPTPVSTPHLHVLSSVVVLIHSFRFMLLAAALDDVAHVTIAT